MKSLILILLMLISLTGFSQQRDMGRMERAQKIKMTPEQRAEISSKRMALALDLTESQRMEIETLHFEQLNENKTRITERRKTARENAKKRDERSIKNLDKRLSHQEKMKEILNEEQYAKWKESVNTPSGRNNSIKRKTI